VDCEQAYEKSERVVVRGSLPRRWVHLYTLIDHMLVWL
jgi:hypothetical protein